ncbi:MAG: hypothetical protein JNK60_23360, partial [Acidobacteria bacterium]|nr:hypothetical protein [Acidobacteriota bacterium]
AQLVFLAHQGKTTLREKIPGVTRRMPDLPGATPHYTHGWTVASPIWMTRKLKEARGPATKPAPEPKELKLDVTAVEDRVKFDKAQLWKGSLVPASPADNWLTSGSAAYWNLLNALPEDTAKAYRQLGERLATANAKHAWLAAREGDLTAAEGAQVHDRYAPYAIPRVRGTFALHQLRLALGNGPFFRAMRAVHEEYREKPISADGFAASVARAAKRDRKDIDAILSPWLTRKGFPAPKPSLTVTPKGKEFTVTLTVAQTGAPWPLRGSVLVESPGALVVKPFDGDRAEWTLAEKPTRVTFASGWDFPVALESPYTFGSFADDFAKTLVVYGTVRQEEAHHTLAHRLATTLADGTSEILPRLVKDSDLTAEELFSHDLVLVGAPSENSVTASLAASLPATFASNVFTHQGKAYTRVDDGLYAVMPNPKNPKRAVHLFAANSVNELHQVTKSYPVGVPQWAVFRGDEVKAQGFHVPSGFELRP